MADIISKVRKRTRPADTAAGARERVVAAGAAGADVAPETAHLIPLVEMLFFAYRDFTGEADAMLDAYALGRAHHRVLHFVHRNPGIRVADLLDLLKIKKQSLGRVLRKLVAEGWIEQTPGAADRRERRLTLTAAGRELAADLSTLQTRRVSAALDEVAGTDGPQLKMQVRNFLLAMIAPEERAAIIALVDPGLQAKREANP